MKKATQKTIFKLLSLVLTLAMVFAVATIPTLTASAGEVVYVTNKTIDFEEGTDTSKWTFGTGWSVADTPTDFATHGVRSLKCANSALTAVNIKDINLKAGNTYYFSFYYYYVPAAENKSYTYWANFGQNNDAGDGWKQIKAFSANASTAGKWTFFSCSYTAVTDSTAITINCDNSLLYIDDFYILDLEMLNEHGAYISNDGSATVENETYIFGESTNVPVSYVTDSDLGQTVASFDLSTTHAGKGVEIPFAFKAGKTYNISMKYRSKGETGTDANPNWFRATIGDNDAVHPYTNAETVGKTFSMNTNGVWTELSFDYKSITTHNGLHFDANRNDGMKINIKIAYLIITEKEITNTTAKQVYNFESNKFSAYAKNTNGSIATVERDGYLSRALKFNTTASGADVNAKLDVNLTTGKLYKVSYDYKGYATFRVLPNAGVWGSSMYSCEPTGNADISIGSENWKHYETVFLAQYDSPYVYFREYNTTDNASFYIDNFVIEEFTEYANSATFDFELDGIDYGYNNYNLAVDENNTVLKFDGKDTNGRCFYFPTMRMQAGHTYYVSFDYCGEKAFARDIATSGSGVSTSGTWITPSATEWKKSITTYTVTEEDDNGMFIIFCNSPNVNYFDNFFIADITDFYSPVENEEYSFDFEDESEVLIETNYNAVTDLAFEENIDYGRVAKLTFASGSSGVVGKTYIPYTMKAGTTYKVSITYNADAWVGISWADKDNAGNQGSNGINYMNKWATETRYVTGADDMPYFFVVSPKSETNITIANITVTPAGGLEDVNGDGELNASDITLMRNRVLGARDDSKMFEKYADNNEDGNIDICDLVKLNNRTK